jgi:hypothetical protein
MPVLKRKTPLVKKWGFALLADTIFQVMQAANVFPPPDGTRQ